MIKFLLGFLGLDTPGRTATTAEIGSVSLIADIPRYPPFDRGLPLVPIEHIITSQQELIDRIAKTSGMTAGSFDAKLYPAIMNLAHYVHLLPATSKGHHRGAGGLFRLALEIGFYSMQAAQAATFSSRDSMEKRRALHPRWVLATFLAGLACEIYRPVTGMLVVDSDGHKWPQLLQPLYTWAHSQNTQRYFIRWHELASNDLHQVNSAYLINSIFPASSLQYLNEENTEIVAAMTGCITGSTTAGYGNPIQKIVMAARCCVINRDIKASSERYGDFIVGAHLEPHFIDAMRRLIRKGTWGVNAKKSRVWVNHEGAFIGWQGAVKDITALLKSEGIEGIPQDQDTIADILLNSKVIEPAPDNSRYWEICGPPSMQVFTTVKLTNPDILLPTDIEYPEIQESLLLNGPVLALALSKQDTVEIIPGMKLDMETGEIQEGADTSETDVPAQSAVPRVSLFDAMKTSAPKGKEETPAAPAEKPDVEAQPREVAPNNESPIPLPDTKSEQAIKKGDSLEAGTTEMAEAGPADTDKTDAKPVTAENPKAQPKAEAKAPPSTAADLGVMAERLFASIDQDASLYLKAILEDYQARDSSGPVFSAPGGMAISDEELDSHGQASKDSLIRVLWARNWLWTDPEKPNRKLIPLQYRGRKVLAIVLKPEIACGMGFNWMKPKEEK
jgi:conjugal transfer pilus assembly protein TraI